MKISLVCSTDSLSLPSIARLHQEGTLLSVGILERYRTALEPQLLALGIDPVRLSFFSRSNWEADMDSWLESWQPDMVWVFGFPWKLSETILSKVRAGFYNFHFGLFPKYKGADPVFWQIRNRENSGGFVVHRMTQEVDGGPVVWQEEQPIIPGETYGLYCMRMGTLAAGRIGEIKGALERGGFSAQPEGCDSPYLSRPSYQETAIDWERMAADEIEALVNACNPKYGGATSGLGGKEVHILEMAPVDLQDSPEALAGTVVYADQVYGLIVITSDRKFLRINILFTSEGYFSGGKMFAMGVKVGDRFTSFFGENIDRIYS